MQPDPVQTKDAKEVGKTTAEDPDALKLLKVLTELLKVCRKAAMVCSTPWEECRTPPLSLSFVPNTPPPHKHTHTRTHAMHAHAQATMDAASALSRNGVSSQFGSSLLHPTTHHPTPLCTLLPTLVYHATICIHGRRAVPKQQTLTLTLTLTHGRRTVPKQLTLTLTLTLTHCRHTMPKQMMRLSVLVL
jgi:hypothetical protein